MIQTAMLIALGFLLASLLALAFATPFWRRAVRLTEKRLKATMPMSITDIQADKDQVRAEYAVRLCKLEQAYEKEKEKAARYLVDRNKHAVTINTLKAEIRELKDSLAEHANRTRVLEQTIQKRIPELQGQLDRAGQIVATRDAELARMKTAYENQTEALAIAKKTARTYNEEIERLQAALEGGEAKGKLRTNANEALVEENHRLNAELSRLRQELTEAKEFTATDNAALRGELQRLARQMMEAPAGGQPGKDSERKKDEADDSEKPAETAKPKTAAGRKPAARKRSRSRPRRKKGGSLSDRLKNLSAREKA